MRRKMSELWDLLKKATVANVTSGVVLMVGMYILYLMDKPDGILLILGGASTYLWNLKKE